MKNPFHEAREALNVAKREFMAVNSLSVVAAYATNQACENSVRALWQVAIKEPFPHEYFKPFHKPASYVQQLGLEQYYSAPSKEFLAKLHGYALDDARYEGTQAYKDHTKPIAISRGQELIKGTERFIAETEQLATNEEVLRAIQDFDQQLKEA